MKIETFKSLIEESLNSLDRSIKNLVTNSYTDSVIKKVKNHGRNVKSKLTRQYNRLNTELQASVKNTYNEFIQKSDAIITNAVESIKRNANTLRLYSYELYKDMQDRG